MNQTIVPSLAAQSEVLLGVVFSGKEAEVIALIADFLQRNILR